MTKEMKSILESSYKGKEVIAYITYLEERAIYLNDMYKSLNAMYDATQKNLIINMEANRKLSDIIAELAEKKAQNETSK